jgi:hypothetical protein
MKSANTLSAGGMFQQQFEAISIGLTSARLYTDIKINLSAENFR